MRKILASFGLLAGIVLLASLGSIGNAEACQREATGACVASKRAAHAPAPKGRMAPTVGKMACLRILVDPNLTAIVLIGGRGVNGPVLITIRASAGHVVMDRSRGFAVKEFCFRPSLIASYDVITICNGHKPGDGNHHVLSGSHLWSLKRTGHAGDYLSLLGKKRSYAPGVGDVYNESLYARQYGS